MTLQSSDMVRRLSSRLKMWHLALLLQIQQHGSLTRVAEHMASSQPAVTNALAELEGGHLARDINAVASGHATHLHVGVIPFISGQLLSAALKRAHAEMERRVTVTIHEGTRDRLSPRLLAPALRSSPYTVD